MKTFIRIIVVFNVFCFTIFAQNIYNSSEVKLKAPLKQDWSYKATMSNQTEAIDFNTTNGGQKSTTKYFMENHVGAYWFWPSAEYFSSLIGYSLLTIHGFKSDNPDDASMIRGAYRGLGVGFFTVEGNTGVTLFGHGRLKTNLVADIGYTFSSSKLKGFYSSVAYGIPIRLDRNKLVLLDIGIAFIGSPTLFTRIGLLL